MQPVLPAELREYVDLALQGSEMKGIDRSKMELRIVTELVRQGFSDDQIIEWVNEHRLPKHQEEKTASESWLRSLIFQARKSVETRRQSGDTYNTHLRVIGNDHNPKKRTHADPRLGFAVLVALREQEEKGIDPPILTEWRKQIIQISAASALYLPVSFKTAQRLSEALTEFGYVETRKIDGKSSVPILTEKGRIWSQPVFGKWGRTIHLSRHEIRPMVEQDLWLEEDLEPLGFEEFQTSEKTSLLPKRSPEQRHRFGYRKHHDLNGHYRLRFKGNKIRFIQLLSAPEEWLNGPVWDRLVGGYDDDGTERFMVASPDSDDDPVLSLIPWPPPIRYLAPAVELVPDGNGSFELANHLDEDGALVPSVGIVMESWYPFFRPLCEADLVGRVIRVVGKGSNDKKANRWRTYTFSDAGPGVDIRVEVDLEDVVGSIDAARDEITRLPRGWYWMPPKRRALAQRLLAAT